MGSTPLPHVLMISFPSQGNINPLLRLAKQVAAKGVLVTFTTTSDTGHQIISSSDHAVPADDGILVGSGRLRFEFLDMSWRTRQDLKRIGEDMLHMETVGPAAFADLITKPVTYVVNNPFVPWAVDVATDMGIPCAVLWV
ncbi:limonoid UDP-glucosyltransferase-like protein [Carex littledalei]|uniref:Limonoid UDP-glucosyltransferase-like protein n=1 Tax=Carex littledalei TaxID=544730 RepID=A0A833QSW5_9POAL|nr:limonoid UDP-glucosyltransferase-like protein [Carex littledalei]